MSRVLKYLAIVVTALVVTGCASKFKSDVARFHQLPRPSGELFVVVPKDEAKQGSLEFAQYANMVASRLAAYGYKRTADSDDAELIVKVDYSVDEGKTQIKSYPSTYGAYPYPYYYPHYYWPYYSGFDRDEIRSYVVYSRRLTMDIVRPTGEMLFEGRVESMGRDNRLPEVMPYLVDAMFADFPGESGATQRVIIEEGDGDSY